jgi:zinc transport system ATP-binding protein
MPVAPAIQLERVRFAYPGGPPVLRDVDLLVEAGEFVAVAGPNGGGKTTLLRVVLGLERPSSGSARLYGEPATRFSRRARIAYLAQRATLGIESPVTVREVVAAGRAPQRGLFGPLRTADRAIVEEAIARVGLADHAGTPISNLSGGQQQRAYIAKALAGQPDLLVLDEPTAGVDVDAQESLAALLDRLHQELGVTIVLVSHEFGAVERFVERLVLVRGRIVFDGDPSALPATWHDPSHVHL